MVADGIVPASLELEDVGGETDGRSLSDAVRTSRPFAYLAISAGKLLALRDTVGQKPLYFGTGPGGTVAVASLKTALARIGIQQPQPVLPGKLLSLGNAEPRVLFDGSLTRPEEINVTEEEASTRLRELLVASLESNVPTNSALAFSGGLDSTLVAQAAKENDQRPELITVGTKEDQEIKHAREVSRHLGLGLTTRILSRTEVLDCIGEVARTIESSDPTAVGVSIPLFFASKVAQTMGMDCLLAGQLSDELFAGYGRFDELARKEDPKLVGDEVWRSFLAASVNDFEPGDKLATSHRLDLRCPFAFLPLVKYSLQLPAALKVRVIGSKVVRKYILRRTASSWKLPATVVERPKKAVQYSTGVQKILLKEAKRRRLSLSSLLEILL